VDKSLDLQVIETVERHPAVRRVRLVGSRAAGNATVVSDWDFAVETDDFEAVACDIGALLARFEPLAQQWDRLSETRCWMAILPGPVKLDFIFAELHKPQPPWCPERRNLMAVDDHFWDWALWLRSKQARNRSELVAAELGKMFEHVLHPMGVEVPPRSLDAAVASYLIARDRLERDFGVVVPRALGRAVVRVIENAAIT
jgi:hypothetical protein